MCDIARFCIPEGGSQIGSQTSLWAVLAGTEGSLLCHRLNTFTCHLLANLPNSCCECETFHKTSLELCTKLKQNKHTQELLKAPSCDISSVLPGSYPFVILLKERKISNTAQFLYQHLLIVLSPGERKCGRRGTKKRLHSCFSSWCVLLSVTQIESVGCFRHQGAGQSY